ncbi:MAG: NosD domain-containing protein [Candidatus Thorarchaeota archaeon]
MKIKAVLFGILCFLIVSPFFIQPFGFYHEDNTQQKTSWVMSYTDSSPILIDHDDNFTTLGFDGDGSETTPFVIDDLNITSNLECIIIRNTRAYFKITNCYFAPEFDDYSVGITLENVTNAYIGSNIFSGKTTAVNLYYVNDSWCVDNEIEGNVNSGVDLTYSYNCEVEQNHIDGNDNNRGNGIHIMQSYFCNVTENEVANSFTGIKVEYSANCTLDQNTLHDFNYGSEGTMYYPAAIEMSNSQNCTVLQNTIYDSPISGILLVSPQSIVCSNNILSGCGFFPQNLIPGNPGFTTSGDIINSKPILYVWNQTHLSIDGSTYGQVILHEAKFCSITGGDFNESSLGVFISFSTNCTIDDAKSSGNHFAGAMMLSSVNCTFNNMVLEDNSRLHSLLGFAASVWVFGSQNARVTNCDISDSQGAGLLIAASPSTLIANNVFLRNGILVVGMGMPAAADYYFIEKHNTLNGKHFGYFFNETDLTVDGNLYGQILVANSSRVNIVGGDFSDVSSGVTFVLTTNCSLEGATVKQNSYYGLQLISSTNTTIIDNAIDDNPFSAIYSPYSESTDYLNNSISRNGLGIPENQVAPILMVRPYDEVSYNSISHNRYGLQLEGTNITVHKNNISCNAVYGVYAGNADFFNISSNVVSGTYLDQTFGAPGIFISAGTHGVIHNNSVYSNSGYGVMLSSLSATNIMVYWNEIGWNGIGNAADGGTDNLWDDNVTTGNAWSDYVGPGTYPISMSSSVDRYPISLTDGTTPTVDSPGDEVFEAGTLGNEIAWQASDNYPGRFVVYQNGTVIANRTWCFDPIEVELDPLVVGTHNLTIVVYDGAGNHVSDMVLVDAVDTISPTIDSPDDIEYVAGETGNNIIWHGSDLNPASYEVFVNDVSTETGDWTSSADPIIVDADGLTAGEYNYTIVLADQGSNTVSDSVIVTVTEPPTTPTTTTTTTTTTPRNGAIPLMTIWIVLGTVGVVVILVIVVIRMKR